MRLRRLLTVLVLVLPLASWAEQPVLVAKWNFFSLSSEARGDRQVVGVITSGNQVEVLVTSPLPQSNQSWLFSADSRGQVLSAVTLPVSNPRAFSVMPDGSRLLLSTDTMRPAQLAIRVDPGGNALSMGELPEYARAIWLEGGALHVYTARGSVLTRSQNNNWSLSPQWAVPTKPATSLDACGNCGAPAQIHALPSGRMLRVTHNNGVVEVAGPNGVWKPQPIHHHWLEEGKAAYASLLASNKTALPNNVRTDFFAVVISTSVTSDGSLYMLVGPHDRRRAFRVLKADKSLAHLTELPCLGTGLSDRFNPVFVSAMADGKVVLADRFGEIRIYQTNPTKEAAE